MTISKNCFPFNRTFQTNDREILAEFFLKFVKSHTYFRNKTISHDFLIEIYKIGHFNSGFSSLRGAISHKLRGFSLKMRDLGYITKYNKNTYKKVKEIDISLDKFKGYFKFFDKKKRSLQEKIFMFLEEDSEKSILKLEEKFPEINEITLKKYRTIYLNQNPEIRSKLENELKPKKSLRAKVFRFLEKDPFTSTEKVYAQFPNAHKPTLQIYKHDFLKINNIKIISEPTIKERVHTFLEQHPIKKLSLLREKFPAVNNSTLNGYRCEFFKNKT